MQKPNGFIDCDVRRDGTDASRGCGVRLGEGRESSDSLVWGSDSSEPSRLLARRQNRGSPAECCTFGPPGSPFACEGRPIRGLLKYSSKLKQAPHGGRRQNCRVAEGGREEVGRCFWPESRCGGWVCKNEPGLLEGDVCFHFGKGLFRFFFSSLRFAASPRSTEQEFMEPQEQLRAQRCGAADMIRFNIRQA